MTQNLKIEVVTESLSESGHIVTNLVTKEELSQVATKKADLGSDGKIPTSQLPENILNTSTIVGEVKTELESTIQDAVQEANAYAESYVDDIVSKKADIGADGKISTTQLPKLDQYSEFKETTDSIKNELTKALKTRTDELEFSKASLDDNGKVLREQLPEFDQFPGVPELLDDLSTRTVQNIEHVIDQAVVEATVKSNAVAYEAATRAEAAAVSANIGNKVYSTPAEGVKAGTGVPVSSYFNVRSPRSEFYVDEYLNRNGVPEATGKSYPSSKGLMDAQAIAAQSAAIAEAAATAAAIAGKVYATAAAGVAAGTGVAVGAHFNVRSSSAESYVDEYQNVGGTAVATGKSYPSGAALNNIPHNNLKDRDMAGAHPASALSYSFLKNQITRSIYDKLYETWSAKDLGAIGDGTIHTVREWVDSGKFSGLAGIQVVFPHVTSLSDSIDWAAAQKAINDLPLAVENTGIFSPRSSPNGGRVYFPHGRFVFNKKLSLKRGVQLVGESRESSQLLFSTNNGGIEYLDSGRDVPDEITIRDLAVFQDQSITPVSGAGITCIDGPSPVDAVALNVENVLIDGFYHNILLSAAITSSIRNVNSTNSVNHGIYVKYSSGYTMSTTIKFDTVYSSLSKNGSGFRIEGASYSFFSACASDSNARYGYELSGTNTCGLDGGAEFNYLGGVHSTRCRSPRIFVNIVANSNNLACDAVTLDETGGAVIGGVHSSGADQGGMSVRAVASGLYGTVEQGLIRTGGWNNPNQRSNASHSIVLGGILNGFTGGTRRQWAFGTPSPLNNIQLHNSGNADSTVEHGFVSDVVLAKNNASVNAAIMARAQTQNTAVTYEVLSGLYSQAPVKGAASTVRRYYGALIGESTIGSVSNVNLMVGGLFAPDGNWNVYSPSTRPSYLGGSLSWKPATSATPTNNGEVTFELTSDTQLKVKVKGSDGVVRSATLTLT